MAANLPTDETLMLHVQQGDAGAFAELVRRHNEKYYALAYRYLGTKEAAEDMVQAAFLKLWEKPHLWKAQNGAKFTTWFYRVVSNMCLDYYKKHKEIAVSEDFEVDSGGKSQDNVMIESEEKDILAREIARLPARQKSALIMHVIQGLSQKETAEVMGVGLKALQSLIMRAKSNLKESVRKYG